jgi:polar amino acid transport system substrate-binding protein
MNLWQHVRKRFLSRFLAPAILVWSAVLMAAASGQTFPSHFDPSARAQSVPGAGVPAIRFLTSPGFPPFNYRDAAGELIGFNVDLARAICTAAEARCTIQPWPWEQATDALAENQGDALIAGLAINPANADRFDFSNVYMVFPARFVVGRNTGADFDPANAGNVFAVRDGSAQAKYAARFFTSATVTGYPDEIAALKAVATGQATAYFGDAMRAAFWLNDNPSCCRFWGEPYFDRAYFGRGMAIALPAGHDAVRLAINRALVRMKQDGTFDELYLKWFPVGFY